MLDSFKIVELGGLTGLTSGPAGRALLAEIERSGFANAPSKQVLKALQDLQPILFEECYVKSFDYIR